MGDNVLGSLHLESMVTGVKVVSLLLEARDLNTGARRLTARLKWEAMADMLFSGNKTMKLCGKNHVKHCIGSLS